MAPSYKSHRPRYPSLSNPAQFQQPPRSTHSARSSSSQASTLSSQLQPTAEQDRNYTPAPLPSPTINDQPCFDNGSLGRQAAQKNALLQAQRQAQQQQAQQQVPSGLTAQQYQQLLQIQQQQQQHDANFQQALQQQRQYAQMANGGYSYNPDLYNTSMPPDETDSYINQYALVAEAAKRAQMAVLERDLNGVDLS